MPYELKFVARLCTLCLLVMAGCAGNCQDEHPTYVVTAFFIGLDKPDESALYAHRLLEKITEEGLHGKMDAAKKPWDCCVEKRDKQVLHCAAIYGKIDVASDRAKIVHVYVIEGSEEGEVTKDLSCDPSQSNESCFDDLLSRMARAVKSHDELCHAGKKCRTSNMQFIAQ